MSHPLDPLIETITQAPNCAVCLRDASKNPWLAPRELPEDLAYFCSKFSGGDLFYRDQPNVPQIGFRLTLAFSEPACSFPADYRADYPRLNTLFEIGYDPDAAEYAVVCVDLHQERFGRIYYVGYGLGDPSPCIQLVGRCFTEWLQALIEIGTLHAEDWRAALKLLRDYYKKFEALTEPVDDAA